MRKKWRKFIILLVIFIGKEKNFVDIHFISKRPPLKNKKL